MSLKDHVVLITGTSGGKGGAMIDAISQHPRLGR
jgi:NAD(P)-dependent dehydrogenase (short-subunit alcohol dehydrogenase family)